MPLFLSLNNFHLIQLVTALDSTLICRRLQNNKHWAQCDGDVCVVFGLRRHYINRKCLRHKEAFFYSSECASFELRARYFNHTNGWWLIDALFIRGSHVMGKWRSWWSAIDFFSVSLSPFSSSSAATQNYSLMSHDLQCLKRESSCELCTKNKLGYYRAKDTRNRE